MNTSDCKKFLMSQPYLSELGLTEANLKRRSKTNIKVDNVTKRMFECDDLPGIGFEVVEHAGHISAWRMVRSTIVPTGGLLLEMNRILMCQMMDNNHVSAHDIPRNFQYENLPQVNNDGDMEDLDFENCELLVLDDNGITCWAGGDWQYPMVFSAVWRKGKMYCGKGVKANHRDGMSNEEMLKIVYPKGVPESMETKGPFDD